MNSTDDKAPVRVGLVALPEASGAVLYGLQEILSSVGTAWPELTGKPSPGRRIETHFVASCRSSFATVTGVPITPDTAFGETVRFDVMIVPDLALESVRDPRGLWPAAASWLRDQYREGASVCSVCTGSVLLAEAGLLDGLEATTHWGACRVFETFYPAVRLRPERVVAPVGPEHRIVTSGGSASWSDLALYLIARFCGREAAVQTAKVFLLGDRADGQLPFAAMARPRQHDDAVIGDCQAWIADHYPVSSAVSRMVEHSGLAARSFKRRFRAATGYTPIEYVQTLRIEEAKQLLETCAAATEEIAERVGYDDPASFRRVFKRMTGITPARYRQRFRGIGAVSA